MPTQFAWGATKDFWQQEQGILAYLILHGATGNPHYLRSGPGIIGVLEPVFPRPRASGLLLPHDRERPADPRGPVRHEEQPRASAITPSSWPISPTSTPAPTSPRAGGSDNSFCLYFKICSIKQQKSINVLPDFMPPGRVRITRVTRQRGGRDEDLGSGQPRRVPDPDGCDATLTRRTGRSNSSSSFKLAPCKRKQRQFRRLDG